MRRVGRQERVWHQLESAPQCQRRTFLPIQALLSDPPARSGQRALLATTQWLTSQSRCMAPHAHSSASFSQPACTFSLQGPVRAASPGLPCGLHMCRFWTELSHSEEPQLSKDFSSDKANTCHQDGAACIGCQIDCFTGSLLGAAGRPEAEGEHGRAGAGVLLHQAARHRGHVPDAGGQAGAGGCPEQAPAESHLLPCHTALWALSLAL